MYFDQRKKKRSFWWLYLGLAIVFIIWVMLDENSVEDSYPLTIPIELPQNGE